MSTMYNIWRIKFGDKGQESISKFFNTILEIKFNSYRERIYKLIQPICPDVKPLECNRCAAIISSIMDGSRMTVGSGIKISTALRKFDNAIRRMVIFLMCNGI